MIYSRAKWCIEDAPIEAFFDSNYVGSLDTRKSPTNYVLISYGTATNWKVNLRKVVALWSTKEEYIVMTKVMKEAIWLKDLAKELRV